MRRLPEKHLKHLAENINENADNPLEASRLANGAFQKALKSATSLASTVESQKTFACFRQKKCAPDLFCL